MAVVCEADLRAHEDVVLDRDTVADRNERLHGHAVAYHDVVLDEAVRADVAAAADLRIGQYHHVLPNASAVAYVLRLHVGQRMYLHAHFPLASFLSALRRPNVIPSMS